MRLFATLAAVALLPAAAVAELNVGDKVPEFTATDDQGDAWRSADHVGKKLVVVYFYPADMTGGCTKQACGFRDDMTELKKLGVEVVGVSGDSPENHRVFKDAYDLNYTLLADEQGKVAELFGVPVTKGEKTFKTTVDGKPVTLTRGVTTARWTFLIDRDGKVVLKNTTVKAAEDSDAIRAAVEKLNTGEPKS